VNGVTLYKLGGSLFDLPDLGDRLTEVFREEASRVLVLAGGGPFAEAIRVRQQTDGLTDGVAHRFAIAAMGQSARWFVGSRTDTVLVPDTNSAENAWGETLSSIAVIDPEPLLNQVRFRPDGVLTEDWRTTSDAIATWIAHRWPVKRLVFLKSVGCDRNELSLRDIERAVAETRLDPITLDILRLFLPNRPTVDWRNLRS